MDKPIVFDIEADGLEDASKIHVLSARVGKKTFSTPDYGNIKTFLGRASVLVGHNIIRYDIPTLERILGVRVRAKLVDTLALSWYLYPFRVKHGLADWGEDLGFGKPKVEDWVGQPYEVYENRCESDVEINTRLWEKMWKDLMKLYNQDESEVWRLIDYLSFKMDCAREQERSRWRLDQDKANAVEDKLSKDYEDVRERLYKVMPKVPVQTTKTVPKKPYKQDGSLSAIGEKWFSLLEDLGKHPSTKEVTYVSGHEEPNPGSDVQIKNWLFSLGWKPCTFKYKRNKETGEVKEIPQIRTKNSNNEPILTPSVEVLCGKVPELEYLREIGVVKHRLDVVRGFLRSVDDEGFIKARISGFTNTLRFKHQEVVNLPGVDKPYGPDLRGCLIAREGYELLGSDMSSLEDRTKQHYMWLYDPEYVKEMLSPDFDPHVDIAVQGGLMSAKEAEDFKAATEDFKTTKVYKALKSVRSVAKATNYSCTYGAGGPTVARSAGITEAEGYKLVDTYWKRNWAINAIAEDCEVKRCLNTKWLKNPVSGFWYSLRHEKDRFSTLNQGTGVYCFDTWIKTFRAKRPQLCGQFHDEVILEVRRGYRDKAEELLRWAIKKTNESLKLNRELDIDVQFGDSYADIH
ncbi:DNA polymerase [Salinivibrio phage CW02]|uniref:DNA polymerase n=1 Tax=Salinivibrio phage CW02 TaxID=1161935 RepID=H9D1E7_9CAUD|nr:DNA polymerase [Salinivibrio phage CW02]AFE86189.1 DNA polymerase [Salinivibrio phage CW02]